MAYIKKLMYLQELQVNGQDVNDNDEDTFDMENDNDGAGENQQPQEDKATQAPEDVANNAAENETENENNANDDDDDFTLDDSTDEDDTEETTTEDEGQDTNQNQGEEQPQEGGNEGDQQQPETDGEGGNDTPPADDGGDDNFDIDAGEGGDAPEEGGESAEGEGGEQPQKAEKKTPANPTDGVSDEDNKASEEEIYDSLTDDQKRIRVLQLKIDFKDLYETMFNTLESIGDIPKTEDNLETLKRLNVFLTKAKSILIDYMENNFDKNTYLENYTIYIKYLAIFRTVSKVLDEMNYTKEKDRK